MQVRSPGTIPRGRLWLARVGLLVTHVAAVPLGFAAGSALWRGDTASSRFLAGAVCYLLLGALLNVLFDRVTKRPWRVTLLTTPLFLLAAATVLALIWIRVRSL